MTVSTGYDSSELKSLSASEKLKEAQAVQHNLIVRLGAVSIASVDGRTLTRQLNLIAEHIKTLKEEVAEECACIPLQIDIMLRNI